MAADPTTDHADLNKTNATWIKHLGFVRLLLMLANIMIALVFTLPTWQELIKHEIPLATKQLNQSDIS